MRKTILTALMLATVLPGAAMAQTGELRHDRTDIREQQRDLQRAQASGDRHEVRDARHDLHGAQREYRDDWRAYRQTNRAVYARGNWRAPFAYQHFREGTVIRPAFYNSRYYIANPGQYRLPPAAYGSRWVRHYDDVLLVNVGTGRVLQVINGFFW
jgi:Ni/Co efflux regulator RcnB